MLRLNARGTRSAARPKARAQEASYEGMLQGVGNGVALGWAKQANMQSRVPVALVVDGEIVAEGVADVARPDLADSGRGDGAHGFLLALPDELQTPARRHILVLAGPERTPLPAAPSFWQQPSPDGTWSDVVWEPGGGLSAKVPSPPPSTEDRAVAAAGWLLDFKEERGSAQPQENDVALLVAELSANARTCAALGIAYIPALVPRKREVIAPRPSREREWVATLSARLHDEDDVELLDLLGVLRDGGARHGGSYHRNDADWNDRGAFYAARALLKEASKRVPALRPPRLRDMRLRQIPEYRGTLADVPKLELRGGELVECELEVAGEAGIAIDPSMLRALRMPVEPRLAQDGAVHLRVYEAPAHDEAARVAIVGDAAALALVPWIAEHADRTTFLWTGSLPVAQLELELPRVVFHLLREADLANAARGEAILPERESTLPALPAAGPAAVAVAAPTHPSAPPTLPAHQTATAASSTQPNTQPAGTVPPPAQPTAQPAATVPPSTPPAQPATPTAPEPVLPPRPRPTVLTTLPAVLARYAAALRAHWEEPDPRWPLMLLGAGLFGFAVLTLVLTRHMSFFQDDYYWILHRRGWNAHTFLEPHNGHLSIVPVTIYKLLFVTVGLQHTWPYRLILVLEHAACVALVYVLARRRAGAWIALIPAVLLLGLGAAAEDLLWAFQIGFLGSLAAGLGTLVCLDRNSRRGDAAAAVLMCVALGSSGVGLAMAAVALVELVAIRAPWRRLWIVLGPLTLYGLWYLGYGTSEALLSNVPRIPAVDLETGSYGFAGFAGLPQIYGQIMLAGALTYLVARGWRGRALPARTLGGIAGALTFWTLTALARAQYEQPGAERYIYPSAVLILIATIGVLRWRRFSPRGWAVLAALLAAAGLSNMRPLFDYARERTQVDAEVRDALGAAQIVGPAGSPGFLPDAHHLPFLTLGEYLAAVRDLGSPAFTPRQIDSQPEDDRELADNVILNAETIPLVQPTAQALRAAAPVAFDRVSGLTVGHAAVAGTPAGCTRLTPSSATSAATFAVVVVTPGHSLYLSLGGSGQVAIYVRRLAHRPQPRPLHVLPAIGTPALLTFPLDGDAALPWHVRLRPSASTVVCLV